jgi:hypothetical protein
MRKSRSLRHKPSASGTFLRDKSNFYRSLGLNCKETGELFGGITFAPLRSRPMTGSGATWKA